MAIDDPDEYYGSYTGTPSVATVTCQPSSGKTRTFALIFIGMGGFSNKPDISSVTFTDADSVVEEDSQAASGTNAYGWAVYKATGSWGDTDTPDCTVTLTTNTDEAGGVSVLFFSSEVSSTLVDWQYDRYEDDATASKTHSVSANSSGDRVFAQLNAYDGTSNTNIDLTSGQTLYRSPEDSANNGITQLAELDTVSQGTDNNDFVALTPGTDNYFSFLVATVEEAGFQALPGAGAITLAGQLPTADHKSYEQVNFRFRNDDGTLGEPAP